MSSYIGWALSGAVAAAMPLWLVKREAQRRATSYPQYEAQVWALFLVVVALIYVGFAFFNGAAPEWIGIEFAGLAAYSLIAFIGAQKWPLLVGPGWLAHALWDQMLHAGGHPGFVPAWYVPLCLGFDVVVGVTLMATLRYKPKGRILGILGGPARKPSRESLGS